MKSILLFGAGKSATCLIDFLLKELLENDWQLTVCDRDIVTANLKINNAPKARVVSILVENDEERKALIQTADIVISLLPPSLHFLVAKDCVLSRKNLLTASYVDENLRSLEKEVTKNNLLFLCEMGLDPGIDHMSAMKIIDSIKEQGGKINSFKSHCGGLISPESDNNPWHYKITWNPRNIVLAGKDGALYREENKIIRKKYSEIFSDCTPVDVPNLASLVWYPNRDSLNYIPLYNLDETNTFIRTTLRHPSFCRGWKTLTNIGLTAINDYKEIEDCKSFKEWFQTKLSGSKALLLIDSFGNEFYDQLEFLDLKSNQLLPENFTCSADILQYCMEDKLAMDDNDKDMIVMLHEIEYSLNNYKSTISSSLIVKGEDTLRTAMAKTVGLPLGIATKLILQNKIKLKGLYIPTIPEIYNPVLAELEQNEIRFNEIII